MPEQDKRESGVTWPLCILYASARVLIQTCSSPCSGSSPGLLDLVSGTTRQAGDEELASSPPRWSGMAVETHTVKVVGAASLRTAKFALVTRLRGRKPRIAPPMPSTLLRAMSRALRLTAAADMIDPLSAKLVVRWSVHAAT